MLDLFLYHPKQPGNLFNMQTEIVKGQLLFKVIALKWNDAEQENDEVNLPEMHLQPFTDWFNKQMSDGWKCQK